MSRVAKSPVKLPNGVSVVLKGQNISVKGSKGTLSFDVPGSVEVRHEDSLLTFAARDGGKSSDALAGTTRALLNNMVNGVTTGFEKKLQLVGVGYRAKATGNLLNMTLGYSHPIDYQIPEGVTVETPTQTDIVLKSSDKHLLGQIAAEIRAFRAPEPYKGKGVRYADETIHRKEAKKK
jgi:large subunit ribosomal protein L6